MRFKQYDIFILEKKFLKSVEKYFNLNEDLSNQKEWVDKIINENTIEGLEDLLIEMGKINTFDDSATLNEFKLWDDLKAWGQRKLDKLRQKYEEFIDSETFKKVHDFIEGGGEFPDNDRERKKLEKESPDLYQALDIMQGGDETLDSLKKGSIKALKQFGIGKKKKKKKKKKRI